MKITPTTLPEVLLIEPLVHRDERGWFMETWRASWLQEQGISVDFVQDNHSKSSRGALRGLHYQLRHPQGKLVRVLQGEIYDVAVDIRRSSPQFGNWVGISLDALSHRQLWIPPGFAHGYCVTSDNAEVAYKCTAYHDSADARCLRWDEPDLSIDWPLQGAPQLSAQDAAAPALKDALLFP